MNCFRLPATALAVATTCMTVTCASLARAESSAAPDPAGISVGIDATPRDAAITGDKGITVHSSRRAARRDPTLVQSLRLRGRAEEAVQAFGTVAPAYCTGSDIKGTDRRESACQLLAHDHQPNPRYPIEVEAHLYWAPRANQPSSPSTKLLRGGRSRASCTFARHHCPLTVSSVGAFSGASKRRSPDRQRRDRLDLDCYEVGRFCDSSLPTNATVPGHPSQRVQEPGQLSLIRFGARYEAGTAALAGSTGIGQEQIKVYISRSFEGGAVVNSSRLDGVLPGDAIAGAGQAELTGDGFDHLAGSYWILARSPTAIAAAPGTADRYLSPLNGVNCLGEFGQLTSTTSGYCSPMRQPPTLPLQQAGVGTVPRSAPPTMYLNYVVLASDGTVPPPMAPTAHVDAVDVHVACIPQPRSPGTPSCVIAGRPPGNTP